VTGGPGAGVQPFGDLARLVVATQERSLGLAQAWSDSMLQLVREQVEGNRAVLEALVSSLAAMERALAAQEETNRALRESLEAHREVVERAGAAQERSLQLVQTAADNLAAVTKAQLEAARAVLSPPGGSLELLQEWNDAVRRLFEAASPPRASRRRRAP
jgi:ABC-type transporter Mla subunit MlaD